MKPAFECLPCISSYLVRNLRHRIASEEERIAIAKEALCYMANSGLDLPPPIMARKINLLIGEKTNFIDSYAEIKDLSTKKALSMLPELREIVEKSADPFETAVRISIAGNIIDFGACHDFSLESIHAEISKALTQELDSTAIMLLKQKTASAKNILFIADNCGEAVFDRLFLEPLKDKLTIAVRGYPILNDMTRREAEMSGYMDIAEVIDTGDCTPGVWLDYSSDAFKRKFDSSNLIICKGQGNYETLSETTKPAFFLLKTKCCVIASQLKTEIGALNIVYKNI